ncbi:unnamed protein product [Brugia pahangi]|uniref:Ferritin n=1 Tax=Brugia pahangi TaxID=6280 RepID=A0A0N4TZ64_BRUPA|nr:unnamed protein product [Brugia pahangi]
MHSSVVFEQLVLDFVVVPVLTVVPLAFLDFTLELVEFEMHAAVVAVAAAEKNEHIYGYVHLHSQLLISRADHNIRNQPELLANEHSVPLEQQPVVQIDVVSAAVAVAGLTVLGSEPTNKVKNNLHKYIKAL